VKRKQDERKIQKEGTEKKRAKIIVIVRYSLLCKKTASRLCKVINELLKDDPDYEIEAKAEEISYSDKLSRRTFKWLEILYQSSVHPDECVNFLPPQSIDFIEGMRRDFLIKETLEDNSKGIKGIVRRHHVRNCLKILEDASSILKKYSEFAEDVDADNDAD